MDMRIELNMALDFVDLRVSGRDAMVFLNDDVKTLVVLSVIYRRSQSTDGSLSLHVLHPFPPLLVLLLRPHCTREWAVVRRGNTEGNTFNGRRMPGEP